MKHLRYGAASDAEQLAELERIVRASPVLMETLTKAREFNLPDWWIVSGAIYNQVWNDLTGRGEMYGVKDIDLFYFDPDTSYEAEDAVIQKGTALFAGNPPVEIRNQARVHLWYKDHFGQDYPVLTSSAHGIDHFACKTHCVGIRSTEGLEIYAPYGLRDMFNFKITPNPILNNRETHVRKAARQLELWPELEVVPWPEEV